jgi:hypothetical protein
MPRNSGLVKLRTGHPPAESGFKTGIQTTARLGHLFLFVKNAKLEMKAPLPFDFQRVFLLPI